MHEVKKRKSLSKFSLLFRLLPIVVLVLMGQNMLAQTLQVRGIIKDATGETLIGANVVEKGTTNGMVTGIDGSFTLSVSSRNAVLQFSYVGFVTQEINVNSQSFITVTMQEDVQLMEEVVVVGYGTQKKESVVGAISQLSSADLLETPAANISQAMSGRVPGLFSSQISGSPGSDDVELFIRGRATFASDAQPLVLVDGIERKFSQIAPDDIESISVLKDASATAVYGVRGANGVLLITTKRGREETPVVNLTANFQYQSPTRKESYLNSFQSVMLLEEALHNDGLPSQYSTADIEMYRKSSAGQLSGLDALLYPDVNWHDEVLRKGAPAQRYNLSIRGGTKRMRYYVSGEMYDQSSMIKNLSQDQYGNSSSPHYRRYQFRANTDFFLTSDLSLSINFTTRFEGRSGPNAQDSPRLSEVFYEINHTPGWIFPVKYPNVELGDETKDFYGGSSQYQNNIVARLSNGGYYQELSSYNETNFIASYNLSKLIQGLSAKGMFSFDYDHSHRNNFRADFATYELNDRSNYQNADAYTRFKNDTQYSLNIPTPASIQKIYAEFQINYARKFGNHDVTAMMLYNQNDSRTRNQLYQRYQGLVGRVTYSYSDRYLVEFNAGYNGSENFQRGQRFGFLPSFSLGWRLEQEEFMQITRNWLTNLKLRIGYGQVGNDKYTQRFLYEDRWLTLPNGYYLGTTGNSTIYQTQYPNYNVTWERASKYNLGMEFGIFRKFNGTVDLFHESRNNILTQYLTRPQWVGVVMAAGNLGKAQNSGFEVDLKYNDRLNNDLSYDIGFIFSHAKNKIIDMDEPALKTDYRKREGHPIGQYYGLVVDGFITQADIDGGKLPFSTYGPVQSGDLKYRDMNGDGIIDDRDETFIGFTNVPENMISLNIGINYKNWSLTTMFQGATNVSKFYDNEAIFAFVDGGKVKEHHLNRWDPNQPEAYNLANAKYPLLHYDAYANHNQRLNSYFLRNGAYLRLKNIEMSYRLPSAISSKAGMSNCRFYVNANNLITWDKLDGVIDPESNGSNRYPIMKTVNFGINIQF